MRKCKTPTCEDPVPEVQGRSRPREYCLTCRPKRNKSNPRVIKMAPPEVPVVPTSSVVGTYARRLESAGVLETPEGAHAMFLARLLEEGAGSMTASGAASLSKELRSAMAVALKDAPLEGDMLDELAERRRQKATGA